MSYQIDMTEDKITISDGDKVVCWIQESIADSKANLSLGGQLVSDTAYVLWDELNALISVGCALSLDLHEVSYISNSHLKAIRQAQRSADQKKLRLILQKPSAAVYKALDDAGARMLFDIEE